MLSQITSKFIRCDSSSMFQILSIRSIKVNEDGKYDVYTIQTNDICISPDEGMDTVIDVNLMRSRDDE